MKNKIIRFILEDGDEIIERDIKKFGTACHIVLPSKHTGKKALIVITKKVE